MKHKHAEFIKAWADDNGSVQFRNKNDDGEWIFIGHAGIFEVTYREFRMTPKPEYLYGKLSLDPDGFSIFNKLRLPTDNVRATFIDGKLTAVELITEGDGK